MSGTTDEAQGVANEAIGKVKAVSRRGRRLRKMKADEAAQEAKGDTQQAMGDAKKMP